jgi:hypothetical protein
MTSTHIRVFFFPHMGFQGLVPHAFDVPLNVLSDADHGILARLDGIPIVGRSPNEDSKSLARILEYALPTGAWAPYHVPTQGQVYLVATIDMGDEALYVNGWNEILEDESKLAVVSVPLTGNYPTYWPAQTVAPIRADKIRKVYRILYDVF